VPILGASPAAVLPGLPGRRLTAAQDTTSGIATPPLAAGIAPWTFVTGQVGGAVTSRVFTVPANQPPTQQGDCLIITLNIASGAMTVSAVVDSAGNTYTLDSNSTTTAPQQRNYRCSAANAVAPGVTVTVTTSATNANLCMAGICVPGLAWETVPEVIGTVQTVAQVGSLSGSITPLSDYDLILFANVNQSTGGPNYVQPPFFGWWLNTSVAGTNEVTYSYLACGAGTAGVAQTCTVNFGEVNNARMSGWAFQANQIALADAAAAADAISVVSAGNPPMASLQDTFPGTSVNGTLWNSFPSAGGSVGVSGGLLSLTDTASSALFSVLQSVSTYDLTGSYLFAKLASAGTQAANTLALMKVQVDANNSAQILVQNGTLAAQHQVAGSYSALLGPVTYNAAVHKWLRMREASGTFYFEWSTDGVTWSTLYSEANQWAVTSLQASLQEGSTGTTDPAATSQWAQVNVLQSADVAAAAEALTVSATVNLTDAGAGTEAAAASATVPLPDVAGAAEASAVAAAVPLAEQAGAADAASSPATVPLADVAGAADTATTPQRTLPLADVAGAAEAPSISATVPLADAAGGTEASVAAASVPLTDAGAAAEAMTSGMPVALAEVAGAAEQASVAASASLADAAGAAETFTVTVAVPLAEQAGAADAPVIAGTVPLADRAGAADVLPQPPVAVSPADTAAGADQLSASAATPLADTAAGAEVSAVAATVPLAEQAGAADSLTIPAKTLPVPDAGGAADQLTAAVTSPAADVAGAADALTVQQGIFVTFTDSAGAAEAPTVAAAVPVADQAAAAEAQVIGVPVALADTGAAADATVTAASVPLADVAGGGATLAATAAVPLADTAGAADAESVAAGANPALNDVVAAAEQLASPAAVPLAEAAGAAEQLAVVAGMQVTLGDAAGAADSLAVTVQVALPDAAGAAEALTAAVAAQPALTDAAAATEALSVAQQRAVSDSAAAADALLVTIPVITPQPVWRCGAAAQRWICGLAALRWAVAGAAARWETEPSKPRWAARMSATRWEIAMAEFEPVASISKQNINVTWTSDLGGEDVDPTTAPFVVRFAFPASSGDQQRPATPAAWFSGVWLTPVTGAYKGYIAQCPIGPTADGGLVQLSPGTYDVWSEVQAAGETPREFAGVLRVY